MKKKLMIPKFKNEEEERKFWDHIDLADYFDAKDFQKVSFPNLKPTSRSISIRLPEMMILRLKEKANTLHVPYQALIKQYIAEGVFNREDLENLKIGRERLRDYTKAAENFTTYDAYRKKRRKE